MTAQGTIEELFEDREQTFTQSGEIQYIVKDAVDENGVASVADAGIPSGLDGLVRDQISIVDRINETTWTVKATFLPGQSVSGAFTPLTFTFNTTGGTLHTTQAIDEVARYPALAPVMSGAIGFDGKNLAGVTINVPTYGFTERHFFSDAVVTTAFKVNLRDLTGTVNDASFKGFDAGEVLFTGVTGSKEGDDNWFITYQFAVEKNITGKQIGSITGIAKKGWEHLWVRYQDDVSNDAIAKVPTAVYIDQVYEDGDFSLLGI